MGGKKKGGGGKKKAAAGVPEDDTQVADFWKHYRKKYTEYEVTCCPRIKQQIDEWNEDNNDIPTKFHIWHELGWQGTKAIMEALLEAKYKYCTSIRFWKTFCEDEGVRSICSYVTSNENINFLELLDNKITPLGCEFISRALHPKMNSQVQVLKLDHNPFGSEGVINLAEGIAINPHLRMLSLTYCGIDYEAADALFQIMIYSRSALEEVHFSGNALMNQGVIKVLQGTAIAKSLKKIALADNQFNDDENVLSALLFCMRKNKKVAKYDFKFNSFSNEGLEKITQMLTEQKETYEHVNDIEVPERGSKEVMEEFKKALAANKGSKKGKKGKKGKKKKK